MKLIDQHEVVDGEPVEILPGGAKRPEDRFEEPFPPVVSGDCSGWFQLRFLLPNDTRAMLHGAAAVKRGAERPEARDQAATLASPPYFRSRHGTSGTR
jgi:hypothetical protein